MARVTKERASEAWAFMFGSNRTSLDTATKRRVEAATYRRECGLNTAYAKALVDVLAYAEEQLTKESE